MSSLFTYNPTSFSSQISPQSTPVFYPASSGKEKDSETGYYYFGARYYNSDLSLWLSVDPMSDKYPSLSPYNYCAWNPLKIVDPDGNKIWIIGEDGTQYQYKDNKVYDKSGNEYSGGDKFIDKTYQALSDMSGTKEGLSVIESLVSSNNDYTYTNEKAIEGRSAFVDDKQKFKMGNSIKSDYAHETFHAYQYEHGMRGKTATREIGAFLFETIMNVTIPTWNSFNELSPLFGSPESTYSESMLSLFMDGYSAQHYQNAVNDFFSGSQRGMEYKERGYTAGCIMENPPIRQFLHKRQ